MTDREMPELYWSEPWGVIVPSGSELTPWTSVRKSMNLFELPADAVPLHPPAETPGDVVKAAARTITAGLRRDWTPLTLSQALAEAGLLARPVEVDDATVERVDRAISDLVTLRQQGRFGLAAEKAVEELRDAWTAGRALGEVSRGKQHAYVEGSGATCNVVPDRDGVRCGQAAASPVHGGQVSRGE